MELGNMVFGNSSMDTHRIDRDKFETLFHAYLSYMDFNQYGHYDEKKAIHSDYIDPDDIKKNINEYGKYENDVFSIFPYYWGECECDSDLVHVHKETCPCSWPNFHYKPTDLRIEWYKYPFRDSYSNKSFTVEEFVEILDKCVEEFFK
jgi:hypothetical protein